MTLGNSFYVLVPLIVGLLAMVIRRIRISYPPYPPGPPSDPIIGHLRVMPAENQEVVFQEWSKKYGDVLYLHIPGHSYLVLNSLKSAQELLDMKSGIYSDRPRFVLQELMGYQRTLPFLRYGKLFQKHRRLLQEYFNQRQCQSYFPILTQHTHRLVMNLVRDQNNWKKQLQMFSAAIIVNITYGKDIRSNDDPYVDLTEKVLDSFIACGSPGKTPVDFFPLLRFFPSWFPGAYYAWKARSLRPVVQAMHDYPIEMVTNQLDEGNARPSFLSHHLSRFHGKFEDNGQFCDVRAAACTIFTGGGETTQAALSHFILNMVLFPDIQKRAQIEIDTVTGRNRLPELSDKGTLPYVEAVIKEVIRWNTVVPLGLPHRLIQDDIYRGMFIPAGTVVIANSYAILRDESIYTDPDSFNPDRYMPKPLGNDEPDPVGHFGFGRRICPGRHLADESLWIAVTSIFAILNIGRVTDKEGNQIVPKVELISGLTSHPKPFPCSISFRDKLSESLMRQVMLDDT